MRGDERPDGRVGRARGAGFAILALHLGLSPALFTTWTSDAFEFPKSALLHSVALLWIGIGAQRLLARPAAPFPRQRLRDPVQAGVLALLASGGLSTLTSAHPLSSLLGGARSFMGLLALCAFGVLFFATRSCVAGVRDARRFLALAAAGAIAPCAYAALQLAGFDPLPWSPEVSFHPRPFGTFGNPNFLAAYLVTLLPIVAALALDAGRTRAGLGGWGALVLGLVMSAVMIACLSRASWVALAVLFPALVVGWWRVGERRGALWLVGGAAALAAAGLALVALGTGAGEQIAGGISWRLSSLFRLAGEARVHIWDAAWRMFLDHPLVGVGPDAFGNHFESYRTPEYWLVEWNANPKRAHNELLQVAATQGALGLAAAALLVGGLAAALRRAVRAAREASDRALVVALGAGLLAFLVQSLFSFTVMAVGTLFFTYAGLVSALAYPDGGAEADSAPRESPSALLRAAAWLLVGFVWLSGVAAPFAANVIYTDGLRFAYSAQPRAGAARIGRAIALDPRHELYWVELGAARYFAAEQAKSDAEQRLELSLSRAAHERSIALLPERSYNHVNLARTLLAQSMLRPPDATPAEVFEVYERALALDPVNAYALRDAAYAALVLGESARAEAYAGRLRDLYPQFAAGRLLAGLLALERTDWQRAADELEAAATGEWYLESDRGPAMVWGPLALAHVGLEHAEEALRIAERAQAARPGDPLAWLVRGRAQQMLAARARAAAAAAPTDRERAEQEALARWLTTEARASFARAGIRLR